MADMPPDLPTRVAVLEEIAVSTKQTLAEIRAESRQIRAETKQALIELKAEMDRRFERIEDRLNALTEKVDILRGQVSQLPSMWQLITYTVGAQVTFAGLLLAAYRLGH